MLPNPRQTDASDSQPAARGSSGLLAISPWMLAGFHAIARRRLARAFRAVRVAQAARADVPRDEPLIVYLNHPSWWDPLVGFVIARHLFGSRHFYAPMESMALKRYRIFRRLGMFPVDRDSARGAAQFLRSGQTILNSGHILAVTPQGEFADVRERPVRLRPGLAALLARRGQQGQSTTVLPIAMEYTFWDQRLPEVLLQCGSPLRFSGADAPGSRAHLQEALACALVGVQDELACLAQKRDPAAFSTVLDGARGSAGFYGFVEEVRGLVGRSTDAGDHQSQSVRDVSS